MLTLALAALGLLLGATRDLQRSVSPAQIRANIRRVGWIPMLAFALTGLLVVSMLVVACSLRLVVAAAAAAHVALCAIAAHVADLLESPAAQIGA